MPSRPSQGGGQLPRPIGTATWQINALNICVAYTSLPTDRHLSLRSQNLLKPSSVMIEFTSLSPMVLALAQFTCDSGPQRPSSTGKIIVTKLATKKTATKEKSPFEKDRRRKHHHWLVRSEERRVG